MSIEENITRGSGNVYEDLQIKHPEEMLRKAQLVASLQEIIEKRGLSQREAAKCMGISQPKLSLLLRGQFQGVSETKIMDCLAKLGSEVTITVNPPDTNALKAGFIQLIIGGAPRQHLATGL